jgi:hypothetical protein
VTAIKTNLIFQQIIFLKENYLLFLGLERAKRFEQKLFLNNFIIFAKCKLRISFFCRRQHGTRSVTFFQKEETLRNHSHPKLYKPPRQHSQYENP